MVDARDKDNSELQKEISKIKSILPEAQLAQIDRLKESRVPRVAMLQSSSPKMLKSVIEASVLKGNYDTLGPLNVPPSIRYMGADKR